MEKDMSRFREELTVIRGGAWALAVVLFVGLAGFLLAVPLRIDPEMRVWPALARAAFAICLPLVFGIYVLLASYVYSDAKRRGMRYVLWTLLALLMPSAVGFILYFIMREPLTRCLHCQGVTRPGFAFCPHCGNILGRSCPQCKQTVELDWSHCPHCGVLLKTPANPPAPAAV